MSVTTKMEHGGGTLVVRIPMEFKRRGGRKEIVVPDGLPGNSARNGLVADSLASAIARAFHWQELIDHGRYGSAAELAEALRIDRSYVSRLLRLTLLSPDIVELILRGKDPSGLRVETLTRKMPIVWEEQREKLSVQKRC